MPSFTPLTLTAVTWATLMPVDASIAVSADEAVSLKTPLILLDAERGGKKNGLIPLCEGWYPVDASHYFGPIKNLLAKRLAF